MSAAAGICYLAGVGMLKYERTPQDGLRVVIVGTGRVPETPDMRAVIEADIEHQRRKAAGLE